MKIVLNKLTLENFQGVKQVAIGTDNQNLSIHGDNGTGKTTLFNAFLWMLFNKDCYGKTDFQLKPLEVSGEEIHGLTTSVTALVDIDGKQVELNKTFAEKWTKKRGEAEKQLTGHETNYKIDGVPTIKKDWDKFISDIVSEETFRLITNPMHFNSLHWTKRREILLDIAGDISNADIIASNTDLEALTDALENRTANDHKKVLQARRKEINDRLQQLPPIISELSNSEAEIELDADEVQKSINLLNDEIDSIRAGSNVGTLRISRDEAERELKRLESENTQHLQKHKAHHETEDQARKTQLDTANRKQADLIARSEGLNKLLDQTRDAFKAESAKVFGESTCKYCGQDIPDDQLEAKREFFNTQKSIKLEELNADGKKIKAELEQVKQAIKETSEEADSLSIPIEQKEIEPINQDQIEKHKELIADLDEKIQKANSVIDTTGLEQQRNELQQRLAAHNNAERTRNRLKELSDEEKTLAAELGKIEKEIHLIELFIMTKVDMLESDINGRFGLANFTMFERQINGGINETCITTDKNGVPFGAGLNNAACINVGLDIISTLSKHYDVFAPVFIDNAEAATSIIDPGTQTIKLVVDESASKLTVK